MRKIFVLDTSALIYDPNCFKSFKGNDVLIPITVLDELDKVKKLANEGGKNARVAIRNLDAISNTGEIHIGIEIEDDISIKIDTSAYGAIGLDPTYGDSKILACAAKAKEKSPEQKVILVSKDINLRTRAKAFGLIAEDYEKDKIPSTDMYEGFRMVKNQDAGEALSAAESILIDNYPDLAELYPNECVIFTGEDGKGVAAGRRINNQIKLIKERNVWGLKPRNKEQLFAMDLISDPNIPLITLIGKAGTGKSLISLACGLELTLEKKLTSKMVIYRPIVPMGNDIGYLPGPQPLDAKLLTPNGWITMGEIKIDNFVIGSDGTPKKVLGVYPKGKKDIYKVSFSDGSSTECCEDHLWFTKTRKEEGRKDNVGSIKSLKEIKDTLKVYKAQISNHKIPMIEPVQFSKKEHIIHPYILGFLLGDGTFAENYSVSFTSSDTEIAGICNSLLPSSMKCKIRSKFKNNSFSYSFITVENEFRLKRVENIFNTEINSLGLRHHKSGTKFIPKKYLFSSIEDRLSILQGLMDSDGFVSADGSDVSYCTTSDQLAEDVQFLVESLGGKSNINNKFAKAINLHSKIISITLPDNFIPFRLKRKINRFKPRKNELSRMIAKIDFVGQKDAQCILIDSIDHLYATDHLILTHNTMEEKLAPWMSAITDGFEFLLDTNSKDGWKHKMHQFVEDGRIQMEALTYVRGRSIPSSFILVDECFPHDQNIEVENGKKRIGILHKMWDSGKTLPRVKTFNENTQTFEYKKITNVWNRGEKELVKITCDNGKIKCTKNHPFLTANRWKKAEELVVGDMIKTTPTNEYHSYGLTVVDKIEFLDEKEVVYDMEVEDNHNFIVFPQGKSLGGLIAHNCQNLSKEEVKTILTRAGMGTKIILTGDIEQIDNSYLDATSNGLTYVVEKFKDSDLAGHITFTKGERSPLASKASEIL